MMRMRSRISCGMLGLPGLPPQTRHVQNNRKPLRCQASTVSGLTIISTWSQRVQMRFIHTQKARSAFVRRSRFGADRRRTPSCCRRARFSRRSSADVLSHAGTAANIASAIRTMVRNNVRRRVKSNHRKTFRVSCKDRSNCISKGGTWLRLNLGWVAFPFHCCAVLGWLLRTTPVLSSAQRPDSGPGNASPRRRPADAPLHCLFRWGFGVSGCINEILDLSGQRGSKPRGLFVGVIYGRGRFQQPVGAAEWRLCEAAENLTIERTL